MQGRVHCAFLFIQFFNILHLYGISYSAKRRQAEQIYTAASPQRIPTALYMMALYLALFPLVSKPQQVFICGNYLQCNQYKCLIFLIYLHTFRSPTGFHSSPTPGSPQLRGSCSPRQKLHLHVGGGLYLNIETETVQSQQIKTNNKEYRRISEAAEPTMLCFKTHHLKTAVYILG